MTTNAVGSNAHESGGTLYGELIKQRSLKDQSKSGCL